MTSSDTLIYHRLIQSFSNPRWKCSISMNSESLKSSSKNHYRGNSGLIGIPPTLQLYGIQLVVSHVRVHNIWVEWIANKAWKAFATLQNRPGENPAWPKEPQTIYHKLYNNIFYRCNILLSNCKNSDEEKINNIAQ